MPNVTHLRPSASPDGESHNPRVQGPVVAFQLSNVREYLSILRDRQNAQLQRWQDLPKNLLRDPTQMAVVHQGGRRIGGVAIVTIIRVEKGLNGYDKSIAMPFKSSI